MTRIACGFACIVISALSWAVGQTSANYAIPRDTINAGVADMSSANFKNAASVGDAVFTGATTSVSYQINSGFRATLDGVTPGSNLVTPSAGANGSISPNTPQLINYGGTTSYTIIPNSGYNANVGGTCGGLLAGNTYTTNAINANCTVIATFSAPQTFPDAPIIGVAMVGDGMASIFFTSPANIGGSPIHAYKLTCMPGNFIATGYAPFITMAGLSNGTPYSCSVTATNLIGTSAPSGSVGATPMPTALTKIGVKSRMTHGAVGAFDIDIDSTQQIGGTVKTEPRLIGAGFTIIFQYNNPVIAPGSVNAADAALIPISTSSPVVAGNEVAVTLYGVAENTRATISLTGVNSIRNDSISVGFLPGDVNGSRSVNASDIAVLKAKSGQITNGANFRFDLNASGSINSSDLSAIKARSGLTLP